MSGPTSRAPLRRVLGPATAFLVGLGVAIGSGIFRNPSLVATLGSPVWILFAWSLGGLFVLASGLVSAELSTRYPEAGGEYVYLREAYGPFVAFFFGWGYTVFIIGGGAATIGAACGEAWVALLGLDRSLAKPCAAATVGGIVAINALGVRAGAGLQNGLTLLKVTALIGVAGVAVAFGDGGTDWRLGWSAGEGTADTGLGLALLGVLPPVLWAYEGTTDAVKLAEEIEDPQRALPRALVGSALALTVLFVGLNAAYLVALDPATLAASDVPAPDAVVAALFGPDAQRLMTAVSLVVFMGSLSATVLATVRVTFALARDGLAPGVLARVSGQQAPVPALLTVGTIAVGIALMGDFEEILAVYFLAAAILFGLAYASLLVFRARDRRAGGAPPGVFRAPGGPAIAVALILVQLAMAAKIVVDLPEQSLSTLGLLGAVAVVYAVWRHAGSGGDTGSGNAA